MAFTRVILLQLFLTRKKEDEEKKDGKKAISTINLNSEQQGEPQMHSKYSAMQNQD